MDWVVDCRDCGSSEPYLLNFGLSLFLISQLLHYLIHLQLCALTFGSLFGVIALALNGLDFGLLLPWPFFDCLYLFLFRHRNNFNN